MEDNMNAAIGIIDILIDAINKKYDYIRDLNSLNINLSEESFEDMVPVIDSIIEDENNHIGKLQQLIDLLSNSEDDIEEGKQETIEIIDNSDEFVESITSMKKKLVLSENFDNVIDDVQAVADPVFVGANEEHDENKKKYEDAMEENKKTAEETIPDEEDTGKDIKSKELKAMHLSEELFEDLSYSQQYDLNSAVYDALADVLFRFSQKGLNISKEELKEAVRWFDFYFWQSDDNLEESCEKKSFKESWDNYEYHDGKWDIVVISKYANGSMDRDILLNGIKVGELWDDGTIDLKEPISDEDKAELVRFTDGELLHESCDKDLEEAIDLSKIDGTITKALQDSAHIINQCKTISELIETVSSILNSSNIDTKYSRKFLDKLSKMKNFVDALQYIYNIILSGSGNKTIQVGESFKESIQCAIAKEQIKRFTEGKMPNNWSIDSYLNRLTEKKHITKKEAKSLREWYSTIK
ncbi:MAG: hypothetical protein IJH55_03990 [Romboutsia sp.]|nr:hypothetical protein [Romboutsia sp.]